MSKIDRRLQLGFWAREALGLHSLPLQRDFDPPPRRGGTIAHDVLTDFVWWLKRAGIDTAECAALDAQWHHQGPAISRPAQRMAEWLNEHEYYRSLADKWTAKRVKRLLKMANFKLWGAM